MVDLNSISYNCKLNFLEIQVSTVVLVLETRSRGLTRGPDAGRSLGMWNGQFSDGFIPASRI